MSKAGEIRKVTIEYDVGIGFTEAENAEYQKTLTLPKGKSVETRSIEVTEECHQAEFDEDGAWREVWRIVPEDGARCFGISQSSEFIDWL